MTANILLPGRQRFGEKERKRERERRVEGPGCTAVVGARFVRTLPERGHHRGDAARTHNNGTGNDYKTHTRHTKWTEITTTDQQSTPCSPRPPPLPFLSRSSSLFRWAPTTVALSRPAAARLLFFFLRCFFPRVSGFFFPPLSRPSTCFCWWQPAFTRALPAHWSFFLLLLLLLVLFLAASTCSAPLANTVTASHRGFQCSFLPDDEHLVTCTDSDTDAALVTIGGRGRATHDSCRSANRACSRANLREHPLVKHSTARY